MDIIEGEIITTIIEGEIVLNTDPPSSEGINYKVVEKPVNSYLKDGYTVVNVNDPTQGCNITFTTTGGELYNYYIVGNTANGQSVGTYNLQTGKYDIVILIVYNAQNHYVTISLDSPLETGQVLYMRDCNVSIPLPAGLCAINFQTTIKPKRFEFVYYAEGAT